jgi:hypothetical protein
VQPEKIRMTALPLKSDHVSLLFVHPVTGKTPRIFVGWP